MLESRRGLLGWLYLRDLVHAGQLLKRQGIVCSPTRLLRCSLGRCLFWQAVLMGAGRGWCLRVDLALLRWLLVRDTVHAGKLLAAALFAPEPGPGYAPYRVLPWLVGCPDGSRAGLVLESRRGFAGMAPPRHLRCCSYLS